jgi:Rrf2 family protein
MRLTHLADYAVVLMTAAARRDPGERLSANALAAETGVPLPTAQKLMGLLANAGLLASMRGQGGGFSLNREVAAISLADIVEAVEGPFVMTQCADGLNHECLLDKHCRVKPHMGMIGDTVRNALSSVTLEQLSAPAQAGAQGASEEALTRSWTPAFAGERR